MGIVMDGVTRMRKLPVTAVEDNTTDNDLYVVFAEVGSNKELKVSSDKFKFNPSTGMLKTTKVVGAVYNDIADYIEVEEGFEFTYGKVYVRWVDYTVKKSTQYLEKGVIGIASDTYGFVLGEKEGVNQIPIAIGGWVLAYVDKVYLPGTPLTCMNDGYLTEIYQSDKEKYPERIVALYDRPEVNDMWNGIVVNGRHWVKVR